MSRSLGNKVNRQGRIGRNPRSRRSSRGKGGKSKSYQPSGKTTFLRFLPLGGIDEVTKNMYVYETDDDLVIVDCGIGFSDDEGEENAILIPDFSYVLERSKKIRGVIVTHGHEDHFGALPYLLKRLRVPVYATGLTAAFAKAKIKDRGPKKVDIKDVPVGNKVKLGPFSFEFIRLTHSVPDTMAVALKTPLGTVIHTGDFKLDPTPLDRKLAELGKIERYGREGVLLLVSDSLRADKEGSCPSERIVGETFFHEMQKTKGRVFVTLFSSDISRVQQAIDVSQALGRKVALAGYSLEQKVEIARNLGYLKLPKGTIISGSKAKKLPQGQVAILAAGSQGQYNSALSKMTRGIHRYFKIGQGDLVLFSSDIIPGNEGGINALVTELEEKGAKVLQLEQMPNIHVSGHGFADDLKQVALLAKAKYVIPVGGTPGSAEAYAKMAGGLNYRVIGSGRPVKQGKRRGGGTLFLLKNGEYLEFKRVRGNVLARVAGKVHLREMLVFQD